jgi:hypothetical protein
MRALPFVFLAPVTLALILAGACIDSNPNGAGGTAGTTTSTTVAKQSGECDTDADCPSSDCYELVPGGYRVCRIVPVEATGPSGAQGDFCDTSADCPDNQRCFLETAHCATTEYPPWNVCLSDQCQQDSDCPDPGDPPGIAFCGGPDLTIGLPRRRCVYAFCYRDTDCTEVPGGKCAPISQCCRDIVALGCVYPGGCTSARDCEGGYCSINSLDIRSQCAPQPHPYCNH